MPPNAPLSSQLPQDWIQVLENIQQALAKALLETEERQNALESMKPISLPIIDQEETWQQPLARVDERLRILRSGLQEAEERTTEVGFTLATSEEAIQGWLAEVEAMQRRLVEWKAA